MKTGFSASVILRSSPSRVFTARVEPSTFSIVARTRRVSCAQTGVEQIAAAVQTKSARRSMASSFEEGRTLAHCGHFSGSRSRHPRGPSLRRDRLVDKHLLVEVVGD